VVAEFEAVADFEDKEDVDSFRVRVGPGPCGR
jgi:hypothetical protein